MKIRDRNMRANVDVCDRDCPRRSCYWPRPDPGVFTLGAGYRTRRDDDRKREWMCGTREIDGCPDPKPEPERKVCDAKNRNR